MIYMKRMLEANLSDKVATVLYDIERILSPYSYASFVKYNHYAQLTFCSDPPASYPKNELNKVANLINSLSDNYSVFPTTMSCDDVDVNLFLLKSYNQQPDLLIVIYVNFVDIHTRAMVCNSQGVLDPLCIVLDMLAKGANLSDKRLAAVLYLAKFIKCTENDLRRYCRTNKTTGLLMGLASIKCLSRDYDRIENKLLKDTEENTIFIHDGYSLLCTIIDCCNEFSPEDNDSYKSNYNENFIDWCKYNAPKGLLDDLYNQLKESCWHLYEKYGKE